MQHKTTIRDCTVVVEYVQHGGQREIICADPGGCQEGFPAWIEIDELTFEGAIIPLALIDPEVIEIIEAEICNSLMETA